MRRTLHKILVLLALGWLAVAAGREGWLTVHREVLDPPVGLAPGQWRYRSPPVKRLRGFLRRAGEQVAFPPGSRLGLAVPSPGDLFRTMWAAYFLPDQEIVPAASPYAYTETDYWLALARRIDHPRLRLLYEDRAGAVYRVLPPAGGEGGAAGHEDGAP
jgi:hypothetical protein